MQLVEMVVAELEVVELEVGMGREEEWLVKELLLPAGWLFSG